MVGWWVVGVDAVPCYEYTCGAVARKASNRRLADVMAVPTARRARRRVWERFEELFEGTVCYVERGRPSKSTRPLGVPVDRLLHVASTATGTLDSPRDLRVSKLRRSSFYRRAVACYRSVLLSSTCTCSSYVASDRC